MRTMLSNFINYILCMVLLTHAVKVVSDDDDDYNYAVEFRNKGHVTCECGVMPRKMATIESKILDKIYKDVFESTKNESNATFNLELPELKLCNISNVCFAFYFICNEEDKLNCIERKMVFEVAPKEKYDDTILKVTSTLAFQFLGDPVDIPIGRKISRRELRKAVTCSFPSSLNTAGIYCRTFPTFIKCIQRCAFGYTLEDGIIREMVCKHSENKWLPKGFKECKPFVDCTVSLTSSGTLNCTSLNVMQGPECNIECLHYEEKEAIPETSYTCGIEGEWNPPLPFCANPHSGLELIKAPKNKLHYDYDN